MATLEATGRRHRASIPTVLPQRLPWSSFVAQNIKLWSCEITIPKLVFNRHKVDLLLSLLLVVGGGSYCKASYLPSQGSIEGSPFPSA